MERYYIELLCKKGSGVKAHILLQKNIGGNNAGILNGTLYIALRGGR